MCRCRCPEAPRRRAESAGRSSGFPSGRRFRVGLRVFLLSGEKIVENAVESFFAHVVFPFLLLAALDAEIIPTLDGSIGSALLRAGRLNGQAVRLIRTCSLLCHLFSPFRAFRALLFFGPTIIILICYFKKLSYFCFSMLFCGKMNIFFNSS